MSAQSRQDESPAALRRGWCPSTLKPMATGDGWLVRLHPPGGAFTPAQLARIAALARAHGNGLIEISARGNMQLRGVTEASHPALVAALLAERLVDEHERDGPQRLTLTSPLAGFGPCRPPCPHPEEPQGGVSKDDPVSARTSFETRAWPAPQDEGCWFGHSALIDAATLARAIEDAAHAIPGLPAKTSIVVDDGGPIALDEFPADLRVVALTPEHAAIGLPDGQWRGPIPVAAASGVVEAILREFAGYRARAPEALRRLRNLPADALGALARLPVTAPPALRPNPRRAGLFTTAAGGFAAIAALPFGRCDADVLAALAQAAADCSATRLRLSPWRGIACLGLDAASARHWLATAERSGLIAADDDPRLSVQACAGAPACLRAESETMADAARLSRSIPTLLAAGVDVHVSGCVKACAHPGPAALTLSAREGRYDVILRGTTRDVPVATLDLSEILRRLQPGQDLFTRLTTAGSTTEPAA